MTIVPCRGQGTMAIEGRRETSTHLVTAPIVCGPGPDSWSRRLAAEHDEAFSPPDHQRRPRDPGLGRDRARSGGCPDQQAAERLDTGAPPSQALYPSGRATCSMSVPI